MNIADIAKLIGDGLELAGVGPVPVVDPGTPISTMPAIVLAPSDDELTAGNRGLRHGLDLTVMVPRSSQVEQYARLQELTATVIRSLIPSSVAFTGPIRFASTGGAGSGEPAALVRVIPIAFGGDLDLCP